MRAAKYGDYLELAAALVGRVPEAGLHTDAAHLPEMRLQVRVPTGAFVRPDLFWTFTRLHMGHIARTRFALGASGPTWGGVALFHVKGATPEAATVAPNARGIETHTVGMELVETARKRIRGFDSGPVNAVVVGTPHASLDEARVLAHLLGERRMAANTDIFLNLNRFTAELLEADGTTAILRRAGVSMLRGTCLYWRPEPQGLSGCEMTPSGKFAHYSAAELDLSRRLSSRRRCVDGAVAALVVDAGAFA